MNNTSLVRHLRQHFLVKPIVETKGKRIRYNLANMALIDPSMGQAAEIAKIIDYTVIHYKCFYIQIIVLHKLFTIIKFIILWVVLYNTVINLILILERWFFY